MSKATGARGPTPYQITEAVTRHLLNDRPFPAQAGLDLQQVISAGGEYLAELCELGSDTDRVLKFVTTNALPRYVGVVRYSITAGAVGDVVCDSTDIFRASPKYGSILALVPLVDSAVWEFAKYATTILRISADDRQPDGTGDGPA